MIRSPIARSLVVVAIPLLAAGGLAFTQAQKTPPAAPTTPAAPTAPTAPQIPAEKEKEIRRMLDASGGTAAFTQAKQQMIQQFKSTVPDVPSEFWVEFEKELSVDELVALVIPIYDRHFALDELKAINAFYATPAGRRLAEKTPIITGEAFEIGSAWGQAKARLLVERIDAREAANP